MTRTTFFILIALLWLSPSMCAATTYNVPPGADLQSYIEMAQFGDTIQLQAGATYVGPITLLNKTYAVPFRKEYITIVTAGAYQAFPRGTRVSPEGAGAMAKIVSPGSGQPAIRTEPGAHHYRLVGVEVTLQNAGANAYSLITLGSSGVEQDTLAEVPHHIEIDRCYIHGLPNVHLKRGIELNSRFTDITNSHISECHGQGQEAQAILGWNGPGPFTIVNNFLEGAGENVMFGGAIATIPNLVPSNIQIRGNYFYKPTAWRGGPDQWTVKNLFELKNARKVVVEGNTFENSWRDAQVGFAILFTARSEDGAMPWATVEDVQFSNNIVRHAAFGLQILGQDCGALTCYPATTKKLTISNNLFDDISWLWCGPDCSAGKFLVIVQGADRIVFDHNTIFQTGNIISAAGAPHTNFVFTNNIAPHNDYGIHGDGRAPGNDSIGHFFPGSSIQRNIIAGEDFAGRTWDYTYPVNNFYPRSLDSVGFVDCPGAGPCGSPWTAGDYHGYRLASTSPFKNGGTDGRDPGFDVDALDREINGNPIDNLRFFVYRHYIDVLHRAPDQGGWDAWANYINGCPQGTGYNQCIVDRRVTTARGFFESPESQNNNPRLSVWGAFGSAERHSFNEEYVEQLYLTYLGRRADSGGKQAWLQYIDNTGDYNTLVHGFLYSSEYRSKFGHP